MSKRRTLLAENTACARARSTDKMWSQRSRGARGQSLEGLVGWVLEVEGHADILRATLEMGLM